MEQVESPKGENLGVNSKSSGASRLGRKKAERTLFRRIRKTGVKAVPRAIETPWPT
jgi:hypothetical protein